VPPDVVAGGVQELELEVVGGAVALELEGELVVALPLEGDGLLDDAVTGAGHEVVIQAEGAAVNALVIVDLEGDAFGGDDLPAFGGVERVEDRGLGEGAG